MANYGVLIVVGLGTEAFFIAMLGATAGPRRSTLPPRLRRRPATELTTAAGRRRIALVAATFCAGAGWAFLVLPIPLRWLGLVLSTSC